jgi:hypothetical protein
MRLSNVGLGIGTTSPAGKLHISSGTSGDCKLIIEADTDNNDENDNPLIIFRQDGGLEESAIGMGFTSTASDNLLTLANSVTNGGISFATGTTNGFTNAVERMRITPAGDVGIGTTSPSHQFHVDGNARVGKLLVNASGGHNDSRVNIIGTSTGSHTNIRCTDSAGNQLLLLRNDGPLFVSAVYSQTTSAGANVNVQSNGNIVRSTSSVRYKKDITDATWGLTEVLKLKPKTFKNNAKDEYADEKTYGGFTAEDVHDLGLTEFVEYDKDNQPDALFYGNMVALMAKAIQDLNAKVEALEAK